MAIKITLAKTAGFCFGVKRALQIVKASSDKYSNIEMLGDIVHNEMVSRDIKGLGIKKVKKLSPGKNKVFLIRAHGISKQKIRKAKDLGYKVVDATCPMVKEIHEIASGFEKEYRKVIVIGDKKHAEVKGIIGNIKTNPLIIENMDSNIRNALKDIKKAGVVVQSTQNLEKVEKITKILKEKIKNLKIANTVCDTTRQKQKEIKKMPKQNDMMLIIGSKKSANTRRLYEISKSINKKSYWVQRGKNIKKDWFRNIKKVGITAGASTPDYTITSVIEKIRKLTAK